MGWLSQPFTPARGLATNQRRPRCKNKENLHTMLRRLVKTRTILLAASCLAVTLLAIPVTTRTSKADDLSGRELLSVTRVAHGGSEYSGLQYVTAHAEGFVNAAAFASAGATTVAGIVEVKLGLTDYQDRDLRRRLDISPLGGGALGMG